MRIVSYFHTGRRLGVPHMVPATVPFRSVRSARVASYSLATCSYRMLVSLRMIGTLRMITA